MSKVILSLQEQGWNVSDVLDMEAERLVSLLDAQHSKTVKRVTADEYINMFGIS